MFFGSSLYIPVYPSHQQYLSFAEGDQHFEFVALLFMRPSSSWVLAKVPTSCFFVDPGNSCHRLLKLPSAAGLLSHNFVCQHPKDNLVLSNLLVNQLSKICLSALIPIGKPGSNLGCSPSQNFPSSWKYCLFKVPHVDPQIQKPPPVCLCMRFLGLKVAFFDAVAQFHSRSLQLNILTS